MCFAPQRRALFRHLNLQKWSDNGVLCTFWLRNVFRATTACTFSTSQLPKVVRAWCALYIFTSKCASRHNGVHFFDIATSKSGPTMVCFVHFDLEMCSAPQQRAIFHLSSGQMAPHPPLQRAYFSTLRSHKSLEKHSVSRHSYLFAHLHLLSSDSFSSLIFSLLIFLFSLPLPCSAFHLSILSEVRLLNFLRICIILLCKLMNMIMLDYYSFLPSFLPFFLPFFVFSSFFLFLSFCFFFLSFLFIFIFYPEYFLIQNIFCWSKLTHIHIHTHTSDPTAKPYVMFFFSRAAQKKQKKTIWRHQEILKTSKTYKMFTNHRWRSGTADGLQRIRSYYACAMDGKVDALKLKILLAELCTKQNWQQLAASKLIIER